MIWGQPFPFHISSIHQFRHFCCMVPRKPFTIPCTHWSDKFLGCCCSDYHCTQQTNCQSSETAAFAAKQTTKRRKTQPNRTFHNLTLTKNVEWSILRSSEIPTGAICDFQIAKGPVGNTATTTQLYGDNISRNKQTTRSLLRWGKTT